MYEYVCEKMKDSKGLHNTTIVARYLNVVKVLKLQNNDNHFVFGCFKLIMSNIKFLLKKILNFFGLCNEAFIK